MVPLPTDNRLTGAVERITFHNELNGFSVLQVKVTGQRDLATVVGKVASVSVGERLQCEGQWVKDKTHGIQFHAQALSSHPPPLRGYPARFLPFG